MNTPQTPIRCHPGQKSRPGARVVRIAMVCAVMLWAPMRAVALDPERKPDQYRFAEWNTSHGIPYTAVRSLFQSSDGYLWLVTRGGLARFDGYTFTPFTHANTPVLIDDEIYSLADDAGGTLWIATARGVVWHKDGRWWRPDVLQDFNTASIRWIERDGAGMLFATANTVYRYADGRVETIALPGDTSFTGLRTIARAGRDDWIIIAQTSWRIRGARAELIADEKGNPIEEVYAAVADTDGSWWIGAEGGLFQLQDRTMVHHRSIQGQAIPSARSLLLDRDRNLWIGTRGELLRLTRGAIGLVERPGVDSISNFLCILEDREGNFWGGNDRGLIRLSDTKVVNLTRRDGLQALSIVSTLAARDQSIWLSLWGGGLTRLSPDGAIEKSYREADGLTTDTVWNLAEAPDGTLWLGYYNQGLGRLRDGTITNIPGLPQMKPRLRDMKVDARGVLWISTFGGGLMRVENDTIVPVRVPEVEQTHALMVDPRGLWLTWKGGIGLFDPDAGRWIERHEGGAESQPDAIVLMADARGDHWIVRDEMTIQRLSAGKLQTFVLPVSVGRLSYSGVIHNGELWVDFRNGVLRAPLTAFDKAAASPGATVDFEFFREADGMKSVAPNVYAGQGATVDRKGRLLFATSSGVAIIDPAHIRRISTPPTVLIEQVVIDKTAHHPDDLAHLRPGRGEVQIRFTALGLSNAEQNRFKYRLHPLEQDWVESGRERTAYYGGLAPGEYRFEVIAANADGVWNDEGASRTLRLPPHIYQTWWFYGGIVLSLPLGIWMFVRRHEATLRHDKRRLEDGISARTLELHESNRRLQLQMQETARHATDLKASEDSFRRLNEELESRVHARTAELEAANKELESFSYSVSHDLRAPLRGIDGWSLAIIEDYGQLLDAKGLGYLERVRDESQRLGALIDDLLMLSRTTRTDLKPATIDISALAASTAQRVQATQPASHVAFVCQPGLRAGGDRTLLEVALVNLLENAWKFSSKIAHPRVEFGLADTPRGPAFFVRDNGAGFDMRHVQKLFGVFQRMHAQDEFPGTGVGLATVHRIVQRHGGHIWAESTPGVQTTFYFTLPAGHPHLNT